MHLGEAGNNNAVFKSVGVLPPLHTHLDNCIYFTSQLLQVNNIVLSGNIYLEEESYPNTADNLSKDK